MRARLALISLVFLARTAVAAGPARLDIVGYTVPDSWKVESQGDHVTLTYAPGTSGYMIVGIYGGQPASGDLAADFRREWREIVDKQFKTAGAPTPGMTKIGDGITAAAGLAPASWSSGSLVATLFVLDGGGKVASIVVLSPDAAALKANQDRLVGFLAGVRIARSGDAPSAAAPAPAPPASGGSGKTITVADLAGEWSSSAASARATKGGYGSQYVAGSAVYRISPDGSYTYKSQGGGTGLTSTTYTQTGKFSIDGDGYIVITPKDKEPKRYRFIDWQETDDGTLLTILWWKDKDVMYADHWLRKKK
jgi:hypothetical protein